jgi:methyl-accepting chemotaxis protein
MPPLRSLRFKLILAIVPIAVVAIAALTLIAIDTADTAQRKAVSGRLAELTGRHAAAEDSNFREQQDTSVNLAALMASYHHGDRAEAQRMLQQVARAHPNLLGFWLGYEPDAFDGRDAAFAGVPGQAKAGRFSPYFTRAGGALANVPVDAMEGNEYYDSPKATKKPLVIQPYLASLSPDRGMRRRAGLSDDRGSGVLRS